MTATEFWADIVRRFSLRPGLPLTLQLHGPEESGWTAVVATLKTVDIRTGRETEQNQLIPAVEIPLGGVPEAVAMVRGLLEKALLHELDEVALFDGVQIEDPHLATGEIIRIPDGRSATITSVDREAWVITAMPAPGEFVTMARSEVRHLDEA